MRQFGDVDGMTLSVGVHREVKRLLCIEMVSLKVKGKIYKTVVGPKAMYVSE